jgi:ketosteroid isomerase-like protein
MSTIDYQRNAFESFLHAMHTADHDAIAAHLGDDVVLNSPMLADPVLGRDAVATMLQTVSTLADDLTVHDVLDSETHHAAFFNLRIGETVVNGMDYARLDDTARIVELTVLWRPLPAMVQMQGHIASAIGIPALELRPKGDSP